MRISDWSSDVCSSDLGLILNRQFAARPDRILALEMGGNNPVVVWDTADIRTAAILVVQSAFLSAGQRCTNARRLIVKQAMAEPTTDEEIGRASWRAEVGQCV